GVAMTQASRPSRAWRLLVRLAVTGVVLAMLALASLYAVAGTYGFNVFFRRGLWIGVSVTPHDARASASTRQGLRRPAGARTAGPLAWRAVAPGFEAAELAVLADGHEVDRILLARIDPAHFRFVVRHAPAGNRDLDGWMRALGAALVINGSYFARDGTPATPVLSADVRRGPHHDIA